MGCTWARTPGRETAPAKNKNIWGKYKLSLVEEEDWKGLSHMHAEGFRLYLLRGNGWPIRG